MKDAVFLQKGDVVAVAEVTPDEDTGVIRCRCATTPVDAQPQSCNHTLTSQPYRVFMYGNCMDTDKPNVADVAQSQTNG